jgi:formate dehydrogenase subunit gamma
MSSETYFLPSGRVLRYSFHERLIHWMAGISYVYLLLTGLAFWSPWLFWIAVALGGGTVSASLHRWIGLVFVLATFLMYRLWAAQMKQTPADKGWWEAIGHYIRNEDEKVPSADRFNPGQKFLFWGFFTSGLVLLVTGLVLWFPQSIPWGVGWVRPLCAILHSIAALATIALFMIHVYMGTAMERGAFGSVIRGDVSRAWMQSHHRTWYDQLVKNASARK